MLLQKKPPHNIKPKRQNFSHHYNHGSLWFVWAINARNLLNLLPANVRVLLQYVDGFFKESPISLLDDTRDCSLDAKRFSQIGNILTRHKTFT